MALMLTRHGVLSRLGGYRHHARGLLHGADSHLRKDLRIARTGEVVLSSFAFGVIQGKYKDKGGATLGPLPVDLTAGAAFHILGLLPFLRPYSHHLAALGDGALASFFTTTGYRVGERWTKGGSLTSGIAGMFGDSADSPVTGGKTARMIEQSAKVENKVAGDGGLVANEGKDWVITRRFWPPPQGVGSGGKPYSNSANFGWYYGKEYPGSGHSPGGQSVVQSIGMVHDMNHADYSQLLRFVRPNSLTIDGVPWGWAEALADPTVSKYIQDEGGTVPSPRHPDL